MKVEVRYRCGHSYSMDFFGASQEIEVKLASLRGDTCPTCKEAEGKRKVAHAAREAAIWAKSEGLPDLVGSAGEEAGTIRKMALTRLTDTFPKPSRLPVLLFYLVTETQKALRHEARAVWWLNNAKAPAGAKARELADRAWQDIDFQILKQRGGAV